MAQDLLVCVKKQLPLHRIKRLNVTIMARPIRETPILTGEDAERFVRQMKEVESRRPEEREARRKAFKARVAEAKKLITFCW